MLTRGRQGRGRRGYGQDPVCLHLSPCAGLGGLSVNILT